MIGRYVGLGVVAAIIVGAVAWHQLGLANTVPAAIVAWLIGANLTTFALWGWDKFRAQRQGRRIPEAALLTLAAVGGSVGAYVAMSLFRHKTVKGSFRAMFWLIVAAQSVLLAWAVGEALKG